MNKRGQGLSTNTVILLILGIFVLVFLILGFTIGWGKIVPFLSKNNVDSVVNSCDVSCSTASKYGFCSQPRDLKTDDGELKDVTCNYLAKKQKAYGVEQCLSFSCDVVLLDTMPKDPCSGNEGKTVQVLVDNVLNSTLC